MSRRDTRGREVARRRFLQGLGGTALAIPLLPSLTGDAWAEAQDASEPRFIAVFTSNGGQRVNWFPAGEPDWTVVDGAKNVREVPLAGLPSPMSVVLRPELDDLRDKLTLIRGLDLLQVNAFGHYPTKMLSGYGRLGHYVVTVDQLLAFSDRIYPTQPHLRSLHLTVQGPQAPEDPLSVANVGGVATPIYGLTSARRAFQRLFDGLDGSPERRARLGNRRTLVLDRVRAQYQRLIGSNRIGAVDRQRLEAHVAHLHDLEKRLESHTTLPDGCEPPALPEDLEHGEEQILQVTEDHIDVLVAAIRCGLTRVATLQLCSGTDLRTFPFLPGGPWVEGHHEMSHEADGAADGPLGLIHAWYGEQVAKLLHRLDTVEDPTTGRTYLDNSITYWGNEFGMSHKHFSSGMPVLIAGDGCGALKPGRYLDYRQPHKRYAFLDPSDQEHATDGGMEWRGRAYNELLISFLQAMGLTPADYEQGPDPGFGDYDVAEEGYPLGDRRSPLPNLLS